MPIAHQQLSAYSSTTTNPSLPQTPTSFPIQPSTPSFPTSTAADSEPSAPEMGADQRRALETARNTQANRNLSEIKKARPSVSISVATSGDSGTINPTMRHSVGSIDTSVDSRGRTKRTPSVKDDDWWKSRHSSTSNIRSRSSRPLSRKRSRQHMYNDDDDESINEDKRLTQTFSYSSLMPNRRPTGATPSIEITRRKRSTITPKSASSTTTPKLDYKSWGIGEKTDKKPKTQRMPHTARLSGRYGLNPSVFTDGSDDEDDEQSRKLISIFYNKKKRVQ
eukprot:TRINITY_DN131916_c0_g1_i1.p1 TRINITY_DN131916_c0_g1~~TRINITY_DN131916_c0_g1_i1.p1  ORF type:complete len:279 (-),score=95.46 TRINITY_DN131916_c0_g1_i1:227-1063(-)